MHSYTTNYKYSNLLPCNFSSLPTLLLQVQYARFVTMTQLDDVYLYLSKGKYPDEAGPSLKRAIRLYAKRFKLDDNGKHFEELVLELNCNYCNTGHKLEGG